MNYLWYKIRWPKWLTFVFITPISRTLNFEVSSIFTYLYRTSSSMFAVVCLLILYSQGNEWNSCLFKWSSNDNISVNIFRS